MCTYTSPSHFNHSVFLVAKALDPRADLALWSVDDRDKLAQLVPTYFMAVLQKRGYGQEALPLLQEEVGKWLNRSGALAMPDPVPPPVAYWQRVCLYVPLLGKVALAVFSINPTEAAVERSFSHQSLLHSDLRNRMSEETIHAC